MKGLSKKDYYNILILLGILFLIIIAITRTKYIYGSIVDWESQHFIFPEYFRLLFYETREFFPSFCINLGAGQDIYNFSYYGLYNPIILFSYFLPFIQMSHYIIFVSILGVSASTALFYYWIKSNGYTSGTSFVASLMFMCAGPLIFHSHRQLMFVNYFPFLILGLINIDKYVETKKICGICMMVFLIFLTSYYFAIECIMTLCLYALYKFLTFSKFDLKEFFKYFWKIGVGILLGIIMSLFLIWPTLDIIKQGRDNVGITIQLMDVLMPKFNLEYALYYEYGVGITGIGLVGLIISFFKGKQGTKLLSIILIIPIFFPIVIFLLNGGQYMVAKVLIPFLPLYVLVIAKVSRNIENHNFNFNWSFWIVGISAFFVLIFVKSSTKYLFIGEMAGIAISLFIVLRINKRRVLFITICGFAIFNCFRVNISDNLMTVQQYKYDNSDEKVKLIKGVLDEDAKVYRFAEIGKDKRNVNKIYDSRYYQSSVYSSLTNKNYSNFYSNTFKNNISEHNTGTYTTAYNPLFLDYMGIKYLIQPKTDPIDGSVVFESENYDIYENSDALPLIYAKKKIMTLEDFNALEYPYSVEALMNYAIVDEGVSDSYISKFEEIDFSFKDVEKHGVSFIEENGMEVLKVGKNGANMEYNLSKGIENKYLLLSFDVNSDKDEKNIIINGVKNNLSYDGWRYHNRNYRFHYVISNPSEGLNISFSSGTYKLKNFKAYYLNKDDLFYEDTEEVVIDRNRTKGDKIYGDITLTEESYIKTSIPYATGFDVYIDGKKVDKTCVDTAFLGFKCDAGKHEIFIEYANPVLKKSIIISIIGVTGFIVLYCIEEWKKIKKQEELDFSIMK